MTGGAGIGRALGDPHDGAETVFARQGLPVRVPILFEDGLRGRDSLHVSDVMAARPLALEKDAAVECRDDATGRATPIAAAGRAR